MFKYQKTIICEPGKDEQPFYKGDPVKIKDGFCYHLTDMNDPDFYGAIYETEPLTVIDKNQFFII